MFIAVYCKYAELQKIAAEAEAFRTDKTQVGIRIIEYYKGDTEQCDKVLYTVGCEAVIEPFSARGIEVAPFYKNDTATDAEVVPTTIVRRGRPKRSDAQW